MRLQIKDLNRLDGNRYIKELENERNKFLKTLAFYIAYKNYED